MINVDCDFSRGLLSSRINSLESGFVEFAFYILRNEERVFQQWYSSSSHCIWDTMGRPGYYRAVGFAKRANGDLVIDKSLPIFVNYEMVTGINFGKVSHINNAFLVQGAHYNYPTLSFQKSPEKLFVLLSSAVIRKTMSLPLFNRWTWAAANFFPGDAMCIADPTVEQHPDLSTGWYLGSRDADLVDDLVSVISMYCSERGISNEDVVFWGSSVGGFAALALAARMDGSTAVAINAQSIALNYHSPTQVDLVKKIIFDDISTSEIEACYINRVDMRAAWGRARKSRAVFVQNVLDHHHFYEHFSPLWLSLTGGNVPEDGWHCDGRASVWIYRDENGHGPESLSMASEILTKI